MPDISYRFSEIEYGNSPTDEKIVGVFRFEQGLPGKAGPQHVVVAEVRSTLYAYERLLDLISHTVEQSRALTAGMTMDPFARFEKLVQRLNEAVAAFHEKEPTPINWDRINIFLIECSHDQLCLSGHGSLMNLFLQSKPDGSFQAFDLCGSLDQPSSPDPKKLFSSVICGDMKPGDLFFVGTTNFETMRQELKLKEKLTSVPPVTAAMEIKQGLEQMAPPDDYAGILISCHTVSKPNQAPAAPPKNQAHESMKQLRDQELQTNQSLAPVLNPVKATKPPLSTEALPKAPKPGPGVADIWNKVKGFWPLRRPRPSPAAETAMRSLDAGHGTIFTTRRKILLGLLAIAVVGGVIGYSTYKHNKQVAEERSAWEQKFSQASDFRNRAESSLMYAKDTQTRTEVQKSQEILAALDTGTADRKDRVDKLQAELAQIKERLRKAVAATNVTELYSLPPTTPDGALTAVTMADKLAYAADNASHLVIKIDLTNHAVKTIALPAQTGRIVASSLGEKSLVLLDDAGKFYAVDMTEDKVQALNKMTGTSSTTSLTDMVIYNKKAYVLDGGKGQIIRLNKTTNGFGSPSSYVQSSVVPLSGSVALAIDSNVFVAKADGAVIRLLAGKQEPFALSLIDPPLRALSGLWTEMDDNRLLAVDPADKRLLAYDKNGLLTAQITSPEFTSLRDVASRLGQKQALVISGNRLLLVPLP
jgi:hypothetical protein